MIMNNILKSIKSFKSRINIVLTISIMVGFVACSDVKENSIFDPNYSAPNPDPVISSIEPASGFLAGVDHIVVNGSNFLNGATPARIYFNGFPGKVKAITNERMEVISAIGKTGDSVKVKVSAFQAENFSNIVYYNLQPALTDLPGLKDTDVPMSVTVDAAGYVYVHIIRDNADFGIHKINIADGTMEQVVPPANNIGGWSNMNIGPDGAIYMIRGPRAIFRSLNNSAPANFFVSSNSAEANQFSDFDFDVNDNIWVVGNNKSIVRFNFATKANTYFNFQANLATCRVSAGFLYVGGVYLGKTGVWKFPIDVNGDLGTAEEVFDLSANYPSNTLLNIETTSTGSVLIGVGTSDLTQSSVDNADYNSIIEVKSTGSHSVLYKGVIAPQVSNMTWSSGKFMYIVNRKVEISEGTVIKELFKQKVYQLNLLELRGNAYNGIN